MPLVLSDKLFKQLQADGKVLEVEEDDAEEVESPEEPSEHEKKMELLLADAIGAIRSVKPADNSALIKVLTEYQQKCLEMMAKPAKKRTFTFTVNRDYDTNLINSITAVED